jgi:predicted RNA-binding protein with PIN domain
MARGNSGQKQSAKRVKGTRQQAAFAAPARYLFIDAWNVIHGLPRLSKRVSVGLDCARDALAQMVESIHQAEAIHVVLVFDSRQDTVQTEHPLGVKTFEFLYAPAALSADGAIERMVARLQDPSHSTVISNDAMVRESIRSLGANALGPQELADWARACEERQRQGLTAMRRKNERDWGQRIPL